MEKLEIEEQKSINGGQYRHAPAGRIRYSMRTKSQIASGRRHIKSTLKEFAKTGVKIALTVGIPNNRVRIIAGLVGLAME